MVNSYSIFCLIDSCLTCFFLFGDEFSTAAVDTMFCRVSNGYVGLDKVFYFVFSL